MYNFRPHLRPVDEEADHEDVGPLQPGQRRGGGLERKQRQHDADRVRHDHLKCEHGCVISVEGGRKGGVAWNASSANTMPTVYAITT